MWETSAPGMEAQDPTVGTMRYPEMQLDDLIERALSEQCQATEDRDEDLSYLVEVQERTERATFDRALELAVAATPDRRRLGLRILAELGPWAERTFKVDAVPFLRQRLREETDEDALAAAIRALAWQGDPTTVRDVLQYVRDVRQEVRSASIHNLTQYIVSPCDEELLDALIEATRDSEADNRYSATYDLANWVSAADPRVRNALLMRLDDEDEVVRRFAALGLARDDRGWVALYRRAAHLPGWALHEVLIGGDGGRIALRICGKKDAWDHVAVVVLGQRLTWSGLAEVAPQDWRGWALGLERFLAGGPDVRLSIATDGADVDVVIGRHPQGVPQITGRIGDDGKHWHETITWCWQASEADALLCLRDDLLAAAKR